MADPNAAARTSTNTNSTSLVDTPKYYALSGKIILCCIVILFSIVLFILCLQIYVRWYLHRRARRRMRERRLLYFSHRARTTPDLPASNRGLDPAVLKSLPVFTLSAAAASRDEEKGTAAAVECAVCLCEFQESEEGRMLPGCKHSFHVDCIDMWFHSHSTCPLCRTVVEMQVAPASDTCRHHGDKTSTPSSSSSSSSSTFSSSSPVGEELKPWRMLLLRNILSRDLRFHCGEGGGEGTDSGGLDMERGGGGGGGGGEEDDRSRSLTDQPQR